MLRTHFLFITLISTSSLSLADDARTKGVELFENHVRADLAHHCLECHGGKSVKGDFDLSTRDALMESGYVDESAAESYLMELINHTAEPRMPFKKPKLSDDSIQRIADWIDQGAPYDKPFNSELNSNQEMKVTESDRDFWSFRPLLITEPPHVDQTDWCKTYIDRFVLARLKKNGLSPNKTASRRVLIRRAYFGLLGLPPTPDEVDAFVNSSDPEAWSKLVDKLLESPHYGERWARHWMDVARFAESHGYEQDYDRPHAYHYRDFLIKALNSDMPYDQFVRWQLAGDELAPNDPLAMTATGFLGAGVFPTQLTEAEFESARYDELDDMVTTTGVAFLGLSVGCARCHDHKFDPIPTKDYYRLASTFTSTIRSEIDLNLDPEGNRKKKAGWEEKLARLTTERDEFVKSELPTRFRDFLKTWSPDKTVGTWGLLHVGEVNSTAGTKFVQQDDGSWLSTGPAPNKEVITVQTETALSQLRAIRLETLADDSLPKRGPGRAGNGNFALGNISVVARALNDEAREQPVELVAARATHQQNEGTLSVAASIDDDPVSGWAVDAGGIGKDQAAVFEFAEPVGFMEGTRLTITLTLNHPNTKHTIGRWRLSATQQLHPEATIGSAGMDPKIAAALSELKEVPDTASPAWEVGLSWFKTMMPELQEIEKNIAKHRSIPHQGQNFTKAMISSEGFPHMKHHADGRGYPHFYPTTHILKRGDPNLKEEEAEQNFLQVLMPVGTTSKTWKVESPSDWTRTSFRRATLANWMTDVDQGAGQIAARVIVNRMWHHHFGRGIVSTPNDFGFTGERPTHPELLDWLAKDLVEGGWKLKRLHKRIMTSSVYMQSSDYDEERAKIDRENRLLWRRTPQRLEAEAIRDSMLAVSNQLETTMFGNGTLNQNMKRRSIYFFIKRSKLIPNMMLFDWPEHLVSIGSRGSTTIAPQALMFMNSPQTRQYAAALAAQLPPLPDTAVNVAYRAAFGRAPTKPELSAAIGFLTSQQKYYEENKQQNAARLALTDLCQTLFSMNEFVYID